MTELRLTSFNSLNSAPWTESGSDLHWLSELRDKTEPENTERTHEVCQFVLTYT